VYIYAVGVPSTVRKSGLVYGNVICGVCCYYVILGHGGLRDNVWGKPYNSVTRKFSHNRDPFLYVNR
jgi:hypothetical protein